MQALCRRVWICVNLCVFTHTGESEDFPVSLHVPEYVESRCDRRAFGQAGWHRSIQVSLRWAYPTLPKAGNQDYELKPRGSLPLWTKPQRRWTLCPSQEGFPEEAPLNTSSGQVWGARGEHTLWKLLWLGPDSPGLSSVSTSSPFWLRKLLSEVKLGSQEVAELGFELRPVRHLSPCGSITCQAISPESFVTPPVPGSPPNGAQGTPWEWGPCEEKRRMRPQKRPRLSGQTDSSVLPLPFTSPVTRGRYAWASIQSL